MKMWTGARRAAIATVALVALANAALAEDDSGIHAFLSNMFGQAGGPAPVAAPAPLPAYDAAPQARFRAYRRAVSYRPLTVRRQQLKVVAAVGPTKPAKVSIYDDRTLRPGDAVMTATGVRIFAGSTSWPYTKADFIAIAQAKDLSRETVKVLAGLDSLPRT